MLHTSGSIILIFCNIFIYNFFYYSRRITLLSLHLRVSLVSASCILSVFVSSLPVSEGGDTCSSSSRPRDANESLANSIANSAPPVTAHNRLSQDVDSLQWTSLGTHAPRDPYTMRAAEGRRCGHFSCFEWRTHTFASVPVGCLDDEVTTSPSQRPAKTFHYIHLYTRGKMWEKDMARSLFSHTHTHTYTLYYFMVFSFSMTYFDYLRSEYLKFTVHDPKNKAASASIYLLICLYIYVFLTHGIGWFSLCPDKFTLILSKSLLMSGFCLFPIVVDHWAHKIFFHPKRKVHIQ